MNLGLHSFGCPPLLMPSDAAPEPLGGEGRGGAAEGTVPFPRPAGAGRGRAGARGRTGRAGGPGGAMGPGRGAGGRRRGTVALLWVAAVLCQLGSGSVLRRRLHAAGVPQRRLSGGERRDVQREILAVLGLPGRPRPRAPARAPAAAAPLFMLDLYHAVAGEEEEDEGEEAAVSRPVLTGLSTQSPPPGSVVSRADTVVSLVNMGERRRGAPGASGGTPGCAGQREDRSAPGSTGGAGTCGQEAPGGFGAPGRSEHTGATGACGGTERTGAVPGAWAGPRGTGAHGGTQGTKADRSGRAGAARRRRLSPHSAEPGRHRGDTGGTGTRG